MGFGERLREWLGMKQLGPAIGNKINESDARLGISTSLIVAAIEIIMLLAMLLDPDASLPPGYEELSWERGHVLAYTFLLAASIQLFICSVLYLRGKASSRWLIRVSVSIFDIAALGFGVYISSIDYVQGRMLLVFASMIVLCSCLFIVIPIVTFCMNTVAFLALYLVIDNMTGAASPIAFNMFVFWAIVLVVSTVRFNEKRNAVEAQIEVTEQSLHDALTGLKNRRSLNEAFGTVRGDEVALVMLDVDDFKFFNDAYGHSVGDTVLKRFSNALVSIFPEDSCYRSGGDEFLILAQGLDVPDLHSRLARLQDELMQIKVTDEELLVSSSVGAVMGRVGSTADFQNMLRMADMAMYEAKRQGKNRAVFKSYDASASAVQIAQTPRALAFKIEETDLLTGLPNYTHFRNRAARVLRNPVGYEDGVALVYFDIANFKAFNYEYGYEGGDTYLQSIGKVLRDVFKGQLVARFGEDRFVALTDRKHVVSRVVDAHERAHGYQRGVALELKAGICFPEEGETAVSAMYDRAKLACDSIKTEFDRIYRIYDNELRVQTEHRNHIVSSLDAAIENRWIQVYYQPIVRTQTGKVCGLEALARWIDPNLGMISPGEFVDVLEQHHLVHRLDTYVLETVCADYRGAVDAGRPPVPISVNLSRLDFELCDIFEEVEGAVVRYHMPKKFLHLEVTESALADNSELVRGQIKRFRDVGYQVWMDDFGSGYSSLNLLEEYDFDVLKIDMLFLRGLEEHEESRVIISSIVDMAKQLGIQTLAEGVETPAQLEFLQEIGCEKLQGFLFSEPREPSQIESMVDNGELTVELMESRSYYASTGRVNIVGRSPDGESNDAGVNTGVAPLAVIEFRDGKFHYLSANLSYRKLMEQIGVGSLENAERRFSHGYNKQVNTFFQICQRVKHEGGTQGLDHIINGVHCSTRVSYVASDGDKADAFVACTLADVDLSWSPKESTSLGVMSFLYSVYTRIDVIAQDNGFMENVYLNSGQYYGEFVRDDARISLADFAIENIHPEDRTRFLEYYDMDTAPQRIAEHELSHLSAFFRTVAQGGGYVWQLYMLIPLEKDGKRLWLSCVRDVDPTAKCFVPDKIE